jgi:hypothetical protein
MLTSPWPKTWNKNLFFFAFAFTFLLSAVVRLVWLDFSPALLTQDEASIAFNARSIVETGKDEWGQPWPTVFSAFGDAKQPGMIYTTAAWIGLTGWRVTSVREVSALAGLGVLAAACSWIWLHTRKPDLVLVTAAMVGLSPWPVLLSRLGLESNLALMFVAWGVVCWTLAWKYPKKAWYWGVLGSLLLTLSTYTYIAYRLSLPLVLGAVAAGISWRLWRTKKKPQVLIVLLGSIFLTLILMAPGFLLGSTTRLNQVGLLRSESIAAPLTELRNGCHIWSYGQGVPFLRYGCVLLWNKFTMPLLLVSRSAILHWSPGFWFVTGDNETYRNPTQTGAFTFLLIIPAVFGILAAWRGSQLARLALAIVLLGSLPSIMTDTPQAIRLTPALLGMVTLIVLGIEQIQSELNTRWQSVFPLATWALIVGMGILTIPHFITETTVNPFQWLGHGRQLAEAVRVAQEQDHQVFIETEIMPEPHIFLAVWNDMSPAEYQALDKAPSIDGLGFQRPTQLGSNVQFVTHDWIEYVCALTPEERARTTIITHPKSELNLSSTQLIKESSNVHNMMAVTTFPTTAFALTEQQNMCAPYQVKAAQE